MEETGCEIICGAPTTLAAKGSKMMMMMTMMMMMIKPSQPQRIISGLKETFIKRYYIVEGTNKAEMRPEEQGQKAESSRENLWNEIQLKGK